MTHSFFNKVVKVIPILRVKIYLFAISIAFFSCSEGQKISYFSGTLNEAFQKAKKERKKVFVLMTDSTCGKCNTFEEYLNTQKKTVEILSRDYICVKPDFHKSKDHIYSEILRNPSFPFPYFFNAEGNLLAFGFPESKEFLVNDLTKINVKKFFFREIFDMEITPLQYKALISSCMKATLLLQESNKNTKAAFELFKRSAETFVYPYNLRNIRLLSIRLSTEHVYEKFEEQYIKVPLDNRLYGNMEEYRFLNELENRIDLKVTDIIKFEPNAVEMGALKVGKGTGFMIPIFNVGNKPLVISGVEHPCDCIKFKWTSKTIAPHKSAVIEGIFTPYSLGPFTKEIFIHTSSPAVLMVKAFIKGTVK